MKNKGDKIYYTEDIIDEVCKLGYDRELVADFYYFYSNYLKEYISNKDDIAYYIPNFGTMFITLNGISTSLYTNDQRSSKMTEEGHQKNKDTFLKKRDKIWEYINALKDAGNKKIAYFEKIKKKSNIKNA